MFVTRLLCCVVTCVWWVVDWLCGIAYLMFCWSFVVYHVCCHGVGCVFALCLLCVFDNVVVRLCS